jgi:hypothetical protein
MTRGSKLFLNSSRITGSKFPCAGHGQPLVDITNKVERKTVARFSNRAFILQWALHLCRSVHNKTYRGCTSHEYYSPRGLLLSGRAVLQLWLNPGLGASFIYRNENTNTCNNTTTEYVGVEHVEALPHCTVAVYTRSELLWHSPLNLLLPHWSVTAILILSWIYLAPTYKRSEG